MAAKDHLNGEQLAMFMPAGDLAQHESNDAYGITGIRRPFVDTDMYDSKLADLDDPNLYGGDWFAGGEYETLGDELDDRQVEYPVLLRHPSENKKGKPVIVDGHHRIAWANWKNPKMEVPVEHEINTRSGEFPY